MEEKNSNSLSTPISIIIGSLIIAGAILISGGAVKITPFKGAGVDSGTTGANAGTAAGNVQGSGKTPQEKLTDLAGSIGLDKNKFKVCMQADKYKDEITKDSEDAGKVGADGTPTFFIGKSTGNEINGTRVVGAQPLNVFSALIDEQLKVSAKEPDASESATVSVDDDPVLGDKNAPVTMVEFSDYECPFCKRYFQTTYPTLKKDYVDTGKMKIVFRDLPLSFHEPWAGYSATAANCAREQGGDSVYFKMHDAIFQSTKSNGDGIS